MVNSLINDIYMLSKTAAKNENEIENLLEIADQYEAKANALREEAQKKCKVKKKYSWRPLVIRPIFAVTDTNGNTEYFLREEDAWNYQVYLNENGIAFKDTKKVQLNVKADFWKSDIE